MIKQVEQTEFPLAAKVIRDSFATVAEDFGFTEQNFPRFMGFVTDVGRLQNHANWGWMMYGYYDGGRLVGYASISKVDDGGGAGGATGTGENGGAGGAAGVGETYELHNLAVLPEYRHMGCGKRILEFCKAKVKELGGKKISIGIIEENTVLKNWYAANGFAHTGTKKFDHMPITVGYMEWTADDSSND